MAILVEVEGITSIEALLRVPKGIIVFYDQICAMHSLKPKLPKDST